MSSLAKPPFPPMPRIEPDPKPYGNIILIGMAGVGKSTVGAALAQALNWAFVDTDHIIEAHYGTRLQNIADALTKDEFLDLEARMMGQLMLHRSVIATGGSVVYRKNGMASLKKLGPCIHLHASASIILERIAHNPERGLAIAPGQTIEDLIAEREALYHYYADYTVNAESSPAACVEAIKEWIEGKGKPFMQV